LGRFQHPVGQGAFTMVDMGDDAKISDMLHSGSNFACKDSSIRSSYGNLWQSGQ
jgi:hypothetical protein